MTVAQKLPYAGSPDRVGWAAAPDEVALLRGMMLRQARAILDLQARVSALEIALARPHQAAVPVVPVTPRVSIGQGPIGFIPQLISEAAKLAGARDADVVGPRRLRPLFLARVLVICEACRRGYSLNQIGRSLGGRDHTSILSAAKSEAAALVYFNLPDGFRLGFAEGGTA